MVITKARRGFALAALILVALSAYVVGNAFRVQSESRWVVHTYTVLTQLEHVQRLELEAIANARGYLLSGEIQQNQTFWQTRGQLDDALDGLVGLVSDNPSQRTRAQRLQRAMGERLAFSVRLAAEFDNGKRPAVFSPGQVEQLASLQAEVVALVSAMVAEEDRLLGVRTESSTAALKWLLVAAGLGVPLSLLILGTVYNRLGRENRFRAAAEASATSANVELRANVAQLSALSRHMSALSHYSSMLQSSTSGEEMLEVTRAVVQDLHPDLHVVLYRVRASRDRAEALLSWGDALADSDPLPAPNDCWSMRRNHAYFVENIATGLACPHVHARPDGGSVATACIPLTAQGELLGWMHASGASPGPLAAQSLLVAVCEQLSLALANVRLQDHLRNQAIRDPLTGLFNRRYLEESLEREIGRCQRRGDPLSVLMMDVDHFKDYNDHYGHAGGDAALATFAAHVQQLCRTEDIACRYGGEEFTLILPETDEATAYARAEQLRAGVATLLPVHDGRTLREITVSIGLSVMPAQGTTGADLLRAADAALYRAKQAGRDRVVRASDDRPPGLA